MKDPQMDASEAAADRGDYEKADELYEDYCDQFCSISHPLSEITADHFMEAIWEGALEW